MQTDMARSAAGCTTLAMLCLSTHQQMACARSPGPASWRNCCRRHASGRRHNSRPAQRNNTAVAARPPRRSTHGLAAAGFATDLVADVMVWYLVAEAPVATFAARDARRGVTEDGFCADRSMVR